MSKQTIIILLALLLMGATYTTAITYVTTAPGDTVSIITEVGDSVDVFLQDQTTPAVEYRLHNDLQDVTILNPALSKTSVLTFAPGHGFTLGSEIYIEHFDSTVPEGVPPARIYQAEVVLVAGDVITFDKFLGFDLTPANVVSSKRATTNMGVLGSLAAPVRFHFCTFDGLTMDLTRIMVDMNLAGGPDDGLYGNLTALTNGVFYGFEGDVLDFYLVSIHDNGEYRATAFDVSSNARSGGGGTWGLSVRKSFAGPDKYGVAIRLDPVFNDCFVAYVRDDLTGIPRHTATVMGHIVEP
jgi:hypothetical protein